MYSYLYISVVSDLLSSQLAMLQLICLCWCMYDVYYNSFVWKVLL